MINRDNLNRDKGDKGDLVLEFLVLKRIGFTTYPINPLYPCLFIFCTRSIAQLVVAAVVPVLGQVPFPSSESTTIWINGC